MVKKGKAAAEQKRKADSRQKAGGQASVMSACRRTTLTSE